MEATRKDAIGHWAAAIRHGNSIQAFTDDQGTHYLHYATTPDGFIISTSLHVVAEALGGPTVNPRELVSFILERGTVGENTFYEGINQVFGSQILEIDIDRRSLQVRTVPNTMYTIGDEEQTIDGVVGKYAEEVRSVFEQIAAQPSLALNTTGGLDTRTVLAGLCAVGARPQLLYGVGNSHLTNAKEKDLKIAKEISSRLSLPFYQMNWSGTHPHSPEKIEQLFRKYGFQILTFGAAESLLEELEGGITPYPTLQLGGYCPAFTNMKVWEKRSRTYSHRDLVSHMTALARHLSSNERQQYVEHVDQAMQIALQRGLGTGLKDSMTLREFVQSRLFLYIRPETIGLNFFNEFCYYLAPFLVKRLYDPLLTVPMKYRQRDELQIRLINTMAPELLEIPVFSSNAERIVDLDTFRMYVASTRTGLGRIKSLIPLSVKRMIRRMVSILPKRDTKELSDAQQRDVRIKEDAVRHIQECSLVNRYFRDFEFNLALVYRLRQLIECIGVIEKTSESES